MGWMESGARMAVRRMLRPAAACAALLALPLAASPACAKFVRANLRLTLYHELGHAVIDQLAVPMFGPEEAAADGFAVMLADRLHGEAEMAALVTHVTALGRAQAMAAVDVWSPYLPDGQRIARTICLWYGLRPARRGDLAHALGMPVEAEAGCVEDGRRLRAAWRPVLKRVRPSPGQTPSLRADGDDKALLLLVEDIARLATVVALPKVTPVIVEVCGEDNAFYYQDEDRIALCAEMVETLRSLARR